MTYFGDHEQHAACCCVRCVILKLFARKIPNMNELEGVEGAQAHYYIVIEDYIKTDGRCQPRTRLLQVFLGSDSISKHTSPLLCPRRTFLQR